MSQATQTTLFYDADCGFCQTSADWIAHRDTKKLLSFIPYQTPNLEDDYPQIDLGHSIRGVQLLREDGTVVRDEIAIANCLKNLPGWYWLGAFIQAPVIRWFSHLGYVIVARNRMLISRLLGKGACQLPAQR